MAENGDVLEQIQKQLEGNTLGLSAVADVLQKMESRLEKAEEFEYEEDLQLAEEEQYNALIKGVAEEVIAMIKSDNEVGVDVGETRVGGTKLADPNADDSSKTIGENSSTKDSANVIVSKAGMGMKKNDDDDDDDRRDRRDRSNEDEDDQDEIVAMKKQLEELQKQVSGYQEGIQKSTDSQVAERLERMGFREENGLAAPKILPDNTLGVEGDSFISKANEPEDVVEQLSKLSFKELRVLQERVQSGDTEGIPTELLS
jgi:hypothetical protein